MSQVINSECFRLSLRKILVILAAALAPALGCDGDDTDSMNESDGAPTTRADASLEDPWEDENAPGCRATDEAVDPLPETAENLGSLASKAERIAGTWTNADGDSIMVQLARSGRLHLVTGSPSSSTGRAPSACHTHNYVAVDATVTLVTSDGRFDEVIEGEVRVGGFTSFKANIWLDEIEGSYTSDVSEDGVLGWHGRFGYRSEGWEFEASINDDERLVTLPAFDQRP